MPSNTAIIQAKSERCPRIAAGGCFHSRYKHWRKIFHLAGFISDEDYYRRSSNSASGVDESSGEMIS